jgi:hypothetical protein
MSETSTNWSSMLMPLIMIMTLFQGGGTSSDGSSSLLSLLTLGGGLFG